MTIALLIEKDIKEDISKIKTNVPILEIEKGNFSNLKTYNVLLLLTKKMLNRKDNNYKKVLLFTKKNNIELIEVAVEKSNISHEKSYSKAIIFGFEGNTYKLVQKIIKDFKIRK